MASCYKRVNFYDLCRLCAQNIYKHKIDIFDQEGVKNQLQAKIKKCLSINVKEDDFLPKVVCFKCIKQLDMCNTFREECLNSETMLSSYFQNYRETEEFKQFGQVYIKDVNVASELALAAIKGQTKPTLPESPKNSAESSQSKTKNENQPASSKNSIHVERRHLTTTEELISQTEHIVQVPLTFDSLNEAIKKVVQQLPKEFLNKVIVNSNGEVINLFPQEMVQANQQQQNAPHRVHKHKLMKRREKKVYSPTPQLYENIIKIDLTEENIDDVDKLFKNGNPVPAQNTTSTPSVIFPVPHPQTTHFQNTTFSHSTEDEEDNNNYFAHSTGVIPAAPDNTVINMACNNEDSNIDDPGTPPGPSLLNNDSSSSINMEELQAEDQGTHIKIHTCEECSKKFRRREHLYQHMKLHSGFRPYQCSECKKTFVRKEHLLRHTVLHSGERNFSCDICGKSFSRHDNLLKHIRTHNKEPSYTCERCQKVFIIKHYYDAHCADHEKGIGPILRITV